MEPVQALAVCHNKISYGFPSSWEVALPLRVLTPSSSPLSGENNLPGGGELSYHYILTQSVFCVLPPALTSPIFAGKR